MNWKGLPNGWRYPLVSGTRQRHFDGTHSKPRKLFENAANPTSRVHAVLGNHDLCKTRAPAKGNTASLTKFYLQNSFRQPLIYNFRSALLAKSFKIGFSEGN